MMEVPLANGRGVAVVDEEDYPLVGEYRWVLQLEGKRSYAVYRFMAGGKRRSLRMHRLILPDVSIVDHINGNGLDCRRENLRAADNTRNGFNVGAKQRKRKSSRYKGVHFNKGARPASRPWSATIQAFGERHHLGQFATDEEAAHAYDTGAHKYHGEFARLNFPEKKPVNLEGLPQHDEEARIA